MPIIVPSKDEQRVRSARSSGRYHWALLVRALRLSWPHICGLFTVASLLVLLLAVFDRKASAAMSSWVGISAVLGIVLVLLFLVRGFMKANWEAFSRLREERDHMQRELDALREEARRQ